MIVKIRATIAAGVAWAHNVWAKLPLGIQGALVAIAFAAYAFAAAYNWQLPAGFVPLDPASWHLLFTTGAAFVVAVWAVLYPIITTRLWPQVVPWLLQLLQLLVTPASGPRMVGVTTQRTGRTVFLWKAA